MDAIDIDIFEELVLLAVDNIQTWGESPLVAVQMKLESALDSKVSPAYVYKALNQLEEHGLIGAASLHVQNAKGDKLTVCLLTPKGVSVLRDLRRARRKLMRKTAA